ncbi:MAG: HEPN domain-containing protein [Merismopedia sp. SIO2A8]|nr:HEPN domain-containing protein [Symploca sp. SIO2B6]NET51666.1 HEPN domain-containing protein [Merismopedia sp. SIO2A8]
MTRLEQLLALAQEELETAELLLENGRYQACISRSYYAMYHATQALMSPKPLF